jgi:RNA polymerase sigma-70 factor (ECF subfamily)
LALGFPETDAALVDRVRGGDRSAFGELVKRYQGKVYRLALRFAGSPEEAQEVLQETFLNAFRNLEGFRAESAFSSWLYRITVNAALMHLRKGRAGPQRIALEDLPASVGLVGGEWPDAEMDRREIAEVLAKALDEMPEMARAVFVLRDVEDLSTEQVAEILEITVPTVKTRLHRARLFLRERLARHFEGSA